MTLDNAGVKQIKNKMRSAVVTIGPPLEKPWWWDEAQLDKELCPLTFERIIYKDKISANISTSELPLLAIKILFELLRLRKQYDYIFTFECDLGSFFISFWQTVLFIRKPRHVILQFIMREKTKSLSSRLKYALMKFCFSSLHKAICSSNAEAEYYQSVFGWRKEKTGFVPMHTGATLLEEQPLNGDYILAGGRSFRDYATFVSAVTGLNAKVVIIASRNSPGLQNLPENVELLCDIPGEKFHEYMNKCKMLVLPLEDRKISIGQLVLLHGMALGKPVIATRTAGTADYIENGVDGVLVEPGDVDGLRAAIEKLLTDTVLSNNLGAAARQRIMQQNLPHHYTSMVRKIL